MQTSAQWPRWLYRIGPSGKREGKIFNHPGELKPGWFESDELHSQPVAKEPEKTEGEKLSDDLGSLSREKLIEIAEAAGVRIDKRWNPGKIAAAIKEAAS